MERAARARASRSRAPRSPSSARRGRDQRVGIARPAAPRRRRRRASLASAKLNVCGPTSVGTPTRDRLDQVLAAERQQAAADERDVGRRVVGEHLAHRIAEHDARRRRAPARRRCGARTATPRARSRRGDRVEALRMARHDDQSASPPAAARARAHRASSASSPSRVDAATSTGRVGAEARAQLARRAPARAAARRRRT